MPVARNTRLTASRTDFVTSLWKAGQAHVDEITARIKEGPLRAPEQAERDVRNISVLAKTIRDLAGAESEWRRRDDAAEDMPEDIDSLRAALNDRLGQLSQERAGGG